MISLIQTSPQSLSVHASASTKSTMSGRPQWQWLHCMPTHAVEHYLTYLAMFLGPLITGAHLSVVWLWYTVRLWSITIAHSGYHLPFLQSTEAHDYHHLK